MSTVAQVHHRPSINKSSNNQLFSKAIKDLNNNNENQKSNANKSSDFSDDFELAELPISDSENGGESSVAVSPKKKNNKNSTKPKKQVLNENLLKVIEQEKKDVKKDGNGKVEPAGDTKVSIEYRKINKSPEKPMKLPNSNTTPTSSKPKTKTNIIPKPQEELKDLDQQIENTKEFLDYVQDLDVLKKSSVRALLKSRKDLIKELKEYLQFLESMKISK